MSVYTHTYLDKISSSSGRLIESYNNRCLQELHDFISSSPTPPCHHDNRVAMPTMSPSSRCSQLCLRLTTLRLLSPTVIEELFFAGLIGSVEINSIIPYIMRLDAVEYGALLRGGGIAVTTAAASMVTLSDDDDDDDADDRHTNYLQFSSPTRVVSDSSSRDSKPVLGIAVAGEEIL